MCPECIPAITVMAASAVSTGALSTFFMKGFVCTIGRESPQTDAKERVRHDKHSATPENRNPK
jgi:hypothetical protein